MRLNLVENLSYRFSPLTIFEALSFTGYFKLAIY